MNTQPSPTSLLARAAALLLAVFALFVLYNWAHIDRITDMTAALRLGGALLDALTAFAITAAAGGIGRWLLLRLDRRLPLALDGLTRAERIALEAGLGLGAIALLTLTAGLIGLFIPRALLAGLAAIALLTRRALAGWLRDLRALIEAIRPRGRWEWLGALLAAAALTSAFFTAAAPPVHWDALTYHLVGIQRAIASGRISAHADNFYLGFPENVEMIFGLAVGLFGRFTAAAFVHYGFGLIGALATAGVAARYLGRRGGWTALALLFSAYNFALLFGWPYVDLGAFAYGALLLIAASRWRDTGGRGWLIVMGAAVGLALGVKYTAGAIGASALAVALLWRPRQIVANGLILVLTAALVYLPWAIKGLTLYGNPIYPLIFNGLEWDAGRAAVFSFNERSLLRSGEWWHIPILPIAATVFGRDLTGGYGFTAGMWLLTLWMALPLVLFALDARARALGRLAVALLVPVIAFWGVLSAYSVVGQQIRLMLVALSFCAVGGAVVFHGLERFPIRPINVNWMIRILFAISAGVTLVALTRETLRDQAVSYAVGLTDETGYRYANLGTYVTMIERLDEFPPGTQVRFVFEPRAFDCPAHITCIGDLVLDLWSRPQAAGVPLEAMLTAYRAAGDDYWLVFESGHRAFMEVSQRPAIDAALPAALDRYFVPVWTDGFSYTIYTWR
jgi:hypothetical protein